MLRYYSLQTGTTPFKTGHETNNSEGNIPLRVDDDSS